MSEIKSAGQATSGNFVPPWNKLSVDVRPATSANEVLALCRADYDVILSPVQVENLVTGKFQTVKDRFVTGRLSLSTGVMDNWEVVKGRYEIIPNSTIAQKAISISNLPNYGLTIDRAGVLDNGRKFFVTLYEGSTSVNDVVYHHYLCVMTSHDGSSPITYYCIDVRQDTKSVIRLPSDELVEWQMKKRHTPSAEDSLEEFTSAAKLRKDWTARFPDKVLELQSANYGNSSKRLEEIFNRIWPEDQADTTRKMKHRTEIVSTVTRLYSSSHNLNKFGPTGLSLYNAICEYYDFNRHIEEVDAAQQSFEIDNYCHRKKIESHKSIVGGTDG